MAAILLVVFIVGPALILTFAYSPWFLLLMIALIVVPLFFIRPSSSR